MGYTQSLLNLMHNHFALCVSNAFKWFLFSFNFLFFYFWFSSKRWKINRDMGIGIFFCLCELMVVIKTASDVFSAKNNIRILNRYKNLFVFFISQVFVAFILTKLYPLTQYDAECTFPFFLCKKRFYSRCHFTHFDHLNSMLSHK